MNYSDLSSKLAQVIEQIPKDVLYDFCCSYAQEHEELAMALVNEFWRPEKDDSQRGIMKEIVAECKPFKKSHVCRIDDFLEDAQAKVLSQKRYLSWLQKKVDNTRGGYFRKPYLEKMVRFLDKMGKRDEAVAAMEANKDKDDELRLLYVDMLTEWKMIFL